MRSLDLTQLQEIRRQKAIQKATQKQNQTSETSKRSFNNNSRDEIDLKNERSESHQSDSEHLASNTSEQSNIEEETALEQKRLKLLKERTKTTYAALNEANVARKIEEARRRTALTKAEALSVESKAQKESSDGAWNSKVDKAIRWLKVLFLALLLLILIAISTLGLYYLYRTVTEEPIIKTVKETVTETVEKEVIPEECTQVRRNGKIYVSCDGVTVQGVSTLAESGVEEIPELINE